LILRRLKNNFAADKSVLFPAINANISVLNTWIIEVQITYKKAYELTSADHISYELRRVKKGDEFLVRGNPTPETNVVIRPMEDKDRNIRYRLHGSNVIVSKNNGPFEWLDKNGQWDINGRLVYCEGYFEYLGHWKWKQVIGGKTYEMKQVQQSIDSPNNNPLHS